MTTLSLICAILFSFYLFIGLYVLSRNPRSSANIVFFFITIFLALWALPAFYLYSTDDPAFAGQCIRIGSVGIILFVPSILHFSIIMTPFMRTRPLWHILYLPYFIFAARNLHRPLFFTEINRLDGYWHFSPDFNSPWHRAYSLMTMAYVVTSIVLLFLWYAKAIGKREKRQAFIIALSLTLTTVLIVSEEIMMPVLWADFTPGLAPLTFSILVTGISYSILRYRFLDVSVSLVSDDILANIDESIILIDAGKIINVVNKKTERLLGISRSTLKGKNILSYIEERGDIALKIEELATGKSSSIFARFHYRGDLSPVLVDAKMSPVLDKAEDVVGILIIARESMKNEFIERYGITVREFDVLLKILEGLTIREISLALNIREITVKSHITHIYDKLAVDNRVKLLEILKNYNIVRY